MSSIECAHGYGKFKPEPQLRNGITASAIMPPAFRLRRVLADAKDAYLISSEDAAAFIAEGYAAEPVGAKLSPEKALIFVDGKRLGRLVSRSPIPVRLSPEFLTAAAVALIPFDPARIKH